MIDSIPKSDWVEKFLSQFDYKHVQLVEIPHLSSANFENISQYLSDAWKQKHMGHNVVTLINCRKAIEETRKLIQSEGFVKENTEKKDKTNWKKFIDRARAHFIPHSYRLYHLAATSCYNHFLYYKISTKSQ